MVEVAYFISTVLDVADTEDETGKGNMPKESGDCNQVLGLAVNSCMTVITYVMGRYRQYRYQDWKRLITTSLHEVVFYVDQ